MRYKIKEVNGLPELVTRHEDPRRIVDLRGSRLRLVSGDDYVTRAFLLGGGSPAGVEGPPPPQWNNNAETLGDVDFSLCSFHGDGDLKWAFNVYQIAGRFDVYDCDFKHIGRVGTQSEEGHSLYLKALNGSSILVRESTFRDSLGEAIKIVNRPSEAVVTQTYPFPQSTIQIMGNEITNVAQGAQRGGWGISINNPGHNAIVYDTSVTFGRFKRQAGGMLFGGAQDPSQRMENLLVERVVIAQHGLVFNPNKATMNPALELQGVDSAEIKDSVFLAPFGSHQRIVIHPDCGKVELSRIYAPNFLDVQVAGKGVVHTIKGVGDFTWEA